MNTTAEVLCFPMCVTPGKGPSVKYGGKEQASLLKLCLLSNEYRLFKVCMPFVFNALKCIQLL